MSFNIKNKLERLIGFNSNSNFKSRYKKLFSIKKHILIFSFVLLPPILSYFYFDVDPKTSLFLHSGIPIQGLDFLYMLINLLYVLINLLYVLINLLFCSFLLIYFFIFVEKILVYKKNWFSLQKEMINIELEIEKEFGSVDNLIDIYNKGNDINIDLSDIDIYNLKNENPFSVNKMKNIDKKTRLRIEKLDLRLEKIMKEKEELYLQAKNRKRDVFKKKNLQIEYSSSDISINVSELKDRVFSNIDSLK